MLTSRLAPSSDLPTWALVLAIALSFASLVFLIVEMRRRERGGRPILASGILAVLALLLAVLRPVRVAARESVVGARVVVLGDASRSMALGTDLGASSRAEARDRAIAAIIQNGQNSRISTLGFGSGAPRALAQGPNGSLDPRSDLTSAIHALAASTDERPAAIVVVSDGRLDDPPADAPKNALEALGEALKIPVHTVAVARNGVPDASVRRVSNVGAAVAHVPLPLRVDVGCTGGLACEELTVTARELREDGPPALLASALAHLKDGVGTVDMTVTLERAGPRIVEVEITAPAGDAIPENDRRLVTLNVTRERVRVLHVAGRPTNDVRALRQWLKSDASVDVVAFFILRTPADDPQALPEDLALIPFPVDELFSEHLPSFDAVVLQDFDAQPYGLERHLPALAKYVHSGGGLIMVGGPNSFVAGGYAGTPLGDVLPVMLDASPGATAADTAPFTPSVTSVGKNAPIFAPLRAILGDDLPDMPGANILGDARSGGSVLWTHPTRKTKSGAPMPVLAIGEQGDGRSIALGVDGGWLFEFSELGARAAGRGFGAFWDGLLGWLMRDPRFEPAQIDVVNGCTAGIATTLRVRSNESGPIVLDIARLDKSAAPVHLTGVLAERTDREGEAELTVPPLEAGGYAARLRIGDSAATRRDFACEAGGDEWADSRPDADRLKALAAATGGTFIWANEPAKIPLPKATVVSAERHVAPIAPPWLWTLAAAALLGAHWFIRRRAGLV